MDDTQLVEDLLDKIIATAESVSGLELSPILFDATMVATVALDRHFSVMLNVSDNTGQFRDKRNEYIAHTVAIGMLWRLNPHKQHEALRDSMRTEAAIKKAMKVPENIPKYTTKYLSTLRTVLPNGREYLLTELSFTVTGAFIL